MTDWRSEPPDSPGWWLWRTAPGAGPHTVWVTMQNDKPMWRGSFNPRFPPAAGGQWLKVPE